MGKDVVRKADRGLFARMVLMAQNRQMDMRTVLSYPLGPLPWSLATTDGLLAKTTKSSLLHILEAYAPAMNEIPESATWIIDGVALLQTLKNIPMTFAEFAVTRSKMPNPILEISITWTKQNGAYPFLVSGMETRL